MWMHLLIDEKLILIVTKSTEVAGSTANSPEFQVMHSVIDWFNSLSKQQSVWFQRAWTFISGHMLVIDPTERRGADIVRTEIKEWTQKAEDKNIWADSKYVTQLSDLGLAEVDVRNDQYSVLGFTGKTYAEHPLTPSSSHNVGQHARRHAQTASMPNLTEGPMSVAVPQTKDPQTTEVHSGSIKPRASTFNHSRKASDALSRNSTMSSRSEDQALLVDLSSLLKREIAVLADLDGHYIAFLNPERVKIFSRTPEQAAAEFSDKYSFDIKCRSGSSWEQMQLGGRCLVLRDANTMSVSHYPTWHASLDFIRTLKVIDIFLGPFGGV